MLDGKPGRERPGVGAGSTRNGASAACARSSRAPSPSTSSRPAARDRRRSRARPDRRAPRARRSAAGSTSASERRAVLGQDGLGRSAAASSVRRDGHAEGRAWPRDRGMGPTVTDRAAGGAWQRRGAGRLRAGVSAGPTDRVAQGTTVARTGAPVALDDGAVLLGGAPPRMLHLSPAAAAPAGRGRRVHGHRRDVRRAGPPPARRRDRAPGCRTPAGPPGRRTSPSSSRSRTAPTASPACSPRSRPSLGRRDRRRRRVGRPGRRCAAGRPRARTGGRGAAPPAPPRPGRRAQRRAGRRDAPRSSPSSTPTCVPDPGWLDPLLAHLADPAVGLVAPRIVALPAGRTRRGCGRYEAVRSSLDLGPDPAARRAALPRRLRPERGAARPPRGRRGGVRRRHARRRGRRPRAAPARRGLADALRARRRGSRTTTAPTCARGGCARRSTGPGAAPLALRHRGAVPPMVLSPWAAAVASALLLARRPLAARRRWPRGPCTACPASSAELSPPVARGRPAHRARHGRARSPRPPTPSPATTGRSPHWPALGLRTRPPHRRGRRARRTASSTGCATATATPPCGPACSATSSPTASTTSPTAPACGGVPCATARSSRCARGPAVRDPAEQG